MLLGLFLSWNCQTHYGYRSKVRVDKQKELAVQKKKIASKSQSDSVFSKPDYNLSASNDTGLSPQFYFKEESVFKRDSALIEKRTFQLNENSKSIPPKSKQKSKENTPLNYHAKWSLILGIFSLFVFLFILPVVISFLTYPLILSVVFAPLAIILGFRSLKEIKGMNGSGKGWAITGILLGTLGSIVMLMFIVLSVIYGPAIETYLFFLMSLLFFIFMFNLLVYNIIETSPKNPAFKDHKVNPKTGIKSGMKVFLVILLSILTLLNLWIFIEFSSNPYGP